MMEFLRAKFHFKPLVIVAREVKNDLSIGVKAFLVLMVTKSIERKLTNDIFIIVEFVDIFVDDFPGLPPV